MGRQSMTPLTCNEATRCTLASYILLAPRPRPPPRHLAILPRSKATPHASNFDHFMLLPGVGRVIILIARVEAVQDEMGLV